MSSPANITLHLLGTFVLKRGGQPHELAYEKGKALLAFLAVQPGRPFTRASLAQMFWPNLERGSALTNLRQVLHNLRLVVNGGSPGCDALQVTRDTVVLRADAGLQIDAVGFAAPTPACTDRSKSGICAPCLTAMEDAAGLYRGEFLQGLDLVDCPEVDGWLLAQRDALLQRALARLSEVSDSHERAGSYAKSLPFAQRFLALDPWNEHGLRRVLRLLALAGQRDAALARHAQWCQIVKAELGLDPSAETDVLLEHIRQSEPFRVTRRITDQYQKAPLPLPSAQRRQVTVLHCAWSVVADEDPEDALALLRGPQLRCSEIIRAGSGHVVQTRGGRLLAYFGYPQAHENAARQAVQAGLALARSDFPGVELRVGVHTGMVISGGEPDVPDAVGATSEMAVRVRELVNHGEVGLSHATQRLVGGYFDCESLGLRPLPGARHPVEVFRVLRESGARDRLEAAVTLAPLIGRTQELGALLAAWQEAQQGKPRTVLLQGHAGIGKSRVVRAFQQALREKSVVLVKVRCSPEYTHSPFHPLVMLLQAALNFLPDETPQVQLEKLTQYVQAQTLAGDHDLVPVLARLMSLPLLSQLLALPQPAPTGKAVPPSALQRETTLQIVLDRFYALARPQPFLLIVEDLHWADPSSLELLSLIVTQQRLGGIMALFTARAGFRPPWAEDLCTTIALDALRDEEAASLIGAVAPGLQAAAVRAIVERADGIPLFVEELAKEAASHDLSTIPASLQDLLTSRLDSMGTAKVVAQLAATIGREFSLDHLIGIAPLDRETVTHALHQLREAGLLISGTHGDFQFGHALMRDAAYHSQTRAEREAAHQRIAAALQASGAVVRPELLAQHWSAGGDRRQAVQCWVVAGQLASKHSANHEAIAHFEAGLALVAKLPTGSDATRTELDLQIGLGAALCATQGYSSQAGGQAYARAVDLCAEHDGGLDLFVAAWGLWATASLRVGYDESLALAQKLLRMSEYSAEPTSRQQAHFATGVTWFRQGNFSAARGQFQEISQLYERAHHESQIAAFREDVGVTHGAYLSWTLLFLGYPEQALTTSEQAVHDARRLGHPFSLAYALAFAMGLHDHLRQPQHCLALADEALSLINRHGFTRWKMGAMVARGWALAQHNDPQGVATIQRCVDVNRAAKRSEESIVLAPLADAYVGLGCFDDALRVIDEAFTTGRAKGDHHMDAEFFRLQGMSLLAKGPANHKKAEKCFQKALTVSQQQGARLFGLRAAVDLARLWHTQGKTDRAYQLLAPVYGWFSEGFETPDLQAARQLLAILAVD
jgi:DNA-binding SARP family transcriptional activator/tetratricopeptide (TPR) repeat protein